MSNIIVVNFRPHVETPEVGQKLFFPTTDHNHGGIGTIGRIEPGISAGKEVPFVTCKEAPGTLFNYPLLKERQAELARLGGIASPCRERFFADR